jgi:uncharacterized protein
MRRRHCEITEEREIARILSSTNIGRMATNGADGYPYITPVNFVNLEGKVYFHCAPEGEKLENLKRDPRVCFEVDVPLAYLDSGLDPERRPCTLHQLYHCVIIRGFARILPEGSRKVAALNALVAKHEGTTDSDSVHEKMPAFGLCKVVEIEPVSITGKSDLLQNKSEERRRAVALYLSERRGSEDDKTIKAMGFDSGKVE